MWSTSSSGSVKAYDAASWTGEQLLNKLIYYGVSAITLTNTGAQREGMRGCASAIREDQYDELDRRLALFNKEYEHM